MVGFWPTPRVRSLPYVGCDRVCSSVNHRERVWAPAFGNIDPGGDQDDGRATGRVGDGSVGYDAVEGSVNHTDDDENHEMLEGVKAAPTSPNM